MSGHTSGSAGLQERYAAALMNTFGPPRLVLARGAGAHVWDVDGVEYVDLFAGIAVNALGHAHPALVEAVEGQLRTLGHVSNFFATEPQIEFAERLLAIAGADGGRVFLANSGTEANEAALKLTRRTGRTHLVAAEGAFHGRTMGALALTAKEAYRAPFEPLPGEVTFVPYGDLQALERTVTDQTAAVVLEPVQGEAGVVVPPRSYLAAARRVTRDHGALLWLDEVQTGIGRTGEWFAHQHRELTDPEESDPAASDAAAADPERAGTDVRPDIITLAKGLAGGIPVGACLAVGEAAALLQPGHHGTTFGGNPVACAAALAVLRTIERDGLLDRATKAGELLREVVAAPEVAEVRGLGLLVGVDLVADVAPAVVAAAQQGGFLINSTGPRTIRLAPPLTIAERDLHAFGDAWPGILRAATGGVK